MKQVTLTEMCLISSVHSLAEDPSRFLLEKGMAEKIASHYNNNLHSASRDNAGSGVSLQKFKDGYN